MPSNSAGFAKWVKSPVWIRNSGLKGRPLILSTAAFRVAVTSGFAGLLKPM